MKRKKALSGMPSLWNGGNGRGFCLHYYNSCDISQA